MQTSYFTKCGADVRAVSIAGRAPQSFTGRQYKKLAPKYEFFKLYKDGKIDTIEYARRYKLEVLNELDSLSVYEDIGRDAILLCWELPEEFCHRHLVAGMVRDQLRDRSLRDPRRTSRQPATHGVDQ